MKNKNLPSPWKINSMEKRFKCLYHTYISHRIQNGVWLDFMKIKYNNYTSLHIFYEKSCYQAHPKSFPSLNHLMILRDLRETHQEDTLWSILSPKISLDPQTLSKAFSPKESGNASACHMSCGPYHQCL